MNQGLLLAGAAAVGYYLYTQSHTPGTTTTSHPATGGTPVTTGGGGTQTQTPPPPPPTQTQTPAAPPAPPPAQTNPNSLSAIFARLKSAAQAAGTATASPDGWNYYLAQVAPSVTPPDPTLVFPGYDRTNFLDLTAETYWATMAPYLGAHLGLSGVRRRYFAYGGWD